MTNRFLLLIASASLASFKSAAAQARGQKPLVDCIDPIIGASTMGGTGNL